MVRRERLNGRQRRLLRELEEIADITAVDYGNIREYQAESRTVYLQLMRNQLIRGFVVQRYTLIDEYLASEIARYFFRRRNFTSLWRTKKFRNFNHYILESMTLMEKLALVREIRSIPNTIAAKIERINSLRNGLAHAFFPENLRKSRAVYKGRKIFSRDGVELFAGDALDVLEFLTDMFYGPRRGTRGQLTPGPETLVPEVTT
jgi:hypothetical protein